MTPGRTPGADTEPAVFVPLTERCWRGRGRTADMGRHEVLQQWLVVRGQQVGAGTEPGPAAGFGRPTPPGPPPGADGRGQAGRRRPAGLRPGRAAVRGSRVLRFGVHCGVDRRTSRPRHAGRRHGATTSRHRTRRGVSAWAGRVVSPRGAGCRRAGTARTSRCGRAHSSNATHQRCGHHGCRTPGLNSPVWVPDWGSAQPPEPPDANRSLDPQVREPACSLKAAWARTPTEDDQPHGM